MIAAARNAHLDQVADLDVVAGHADGPKPFRTPVHHALLAEMRAALPVGGSYSLSQVRRFAETLPRMLPVRLVRRGEVTEIVAR